MDLKELLGEELFGQVATVLVNKPDVSVLIDSKKEPVFIPKSRFDEVNTQRKQYKDQADQLVSDLEGMKETAKGNEKLTADLEQARVKLQETEAKINGVKLEAEVKIALKSANARNEKLVSSLLDMSKLTVNDKGEVEGLADQLKALKETDDYLFDLKGTDGDKGGDPNDKGGTGGTGNIGAGASTGGQGGKEESIGARLAKQKSEAVQSSNPNKFFSVE